MKICHFKKGFILLCFALVTCTISCTKDNPSEDIENLETRSIEDEIFQLVNVHRASIGQPPLMQHVLTKELADNHTTYMIAEGEISHFNFDSRAERLTNEANAKAAGENVAFKQKTAKAVMEAWLNSEGHRENIEGNYTHIGISAIKNNAGSYYFTQIFIRL